MQTYGSVIDGELAHPLLAGYDLPERKAILVHKYYLGLEMRNDPGLDCAIRSWETRYAALWRRQRHLCDCQEQIAEIEIHRTRMIELLGEPVSWEVAAHDWISQYAASWRRQHQSQTAGAAR